VPYVIRR